MEIIFFFLVICNLVFGLISDKGGMTYSGLDPPLPNIRFCFELPSKQTWEMPTIQLVDTGI